MPARYIESQGQIYDSQTSRWMGAFDADRLRTLNGGGEDPGDLGDLDTLTVTQLREIAKDEGLTGYSDKTKAELVEAITDYRTASGDTPPSE